MRQNNRHGYLLGCLILFASSCAQADIYIAGAVGGANTIASWDIDSSATFVNPFSFQGGSAFVTLPYESQASENLADGVGQGTLGFRMRLWGWLYAGLEASILQSTSTEALENNGSATEEYDSGGVAPATVQMESMTKVTLLDPDINIDLKLAINTSPYSTLYIKGGVAFNELKLESTTFYAFNNPSANGGDPAESFFTSTVSTAEQQNVVGLHLGAGIEYLINRYVAINMEYSFYDYGDISLSSVDPTKSVIAGGSQPIVPIADGLKTHASAGVTKHVGMIGLILYFGQQYQ